MEVDEDIYFMSDTSSEDDLNLNETSETNETFENFLESSVEEKETSDYEKIDEFQKHFDGMFNNLFLSGVTRDNLDIISKNIGVLLILCKDAVVSAMKNEKEISTVNFIFKEFEEVVKGQQTGYKRTKSVKANRFYVEPKAITYGSKLEAVRKGNKQLVVNKPLLLYQVPALQTIAALFKSDVFKKHYFSRTHECTPGVYYGSCCGSFFQSSGLSVFPHAMVIQIYYDAVNITNPIKSSATKYKIGAFYFRIMNLPSDVQSLHQNIHLLGLLNENDLKGIRSDDNEGFNVVLKHIKADLEIAERDGVTVEHNQTTYKIKIGVLNSTSDNLGLHQLAGTFKNNFSLQKED